jgi:alpha-methylacyl-CoA racemase
MILADFGADVLNIRRPDPSWVDPADGMARGKCILTIDLRQAEGRDIAARLARRADVLLESYRPGAMERLGLGPDELIKANPRLVYARLTGWGQSGPYANRAGHDLNYLAIAGALGVSGDESPSAPPALLGDLANGSYLAVMGIVMALLQREKNGQGQVIDAAIVDGAAYMLTPLFGERASGRWGGERGTHILSGNAPFYGVFACSDGRWFSVGAIEPKFYDAFLSVLGFDDVSRALEDQMDREAWPALKARVAGRFRTRSRDEWTAAFGKVDACGAPVLEVEELPHDAQLASRGTVVSHGGRLCAAPAPRLGGGHMPNITGPNRMLDSVLRDYELDQDLVAKAIASGTLTI